MPIAAVNGLSLYFERAGSGEPLLFISGTGGDLRNKPNQFDGPLGKAFDMISYDQRGLGRSDKPDRRYTMADYADDAAALMDSQGWDHAHVVGVSFGGMVAQELGQITGRSFFVENRPGGATMIGTDARCSGTRPAKARALSRGRCRLLCRRVAACSRPRSSATR